MTVRKTRGEQKGWAAGNRHSGLHLPKHPALDRESQMQKKAHTLLFSRRNHIIWVYRNGEVVSEVDFPKGPISIEGELETATHQVGPLGGGVKDASEAV